MLSRPLDTDVPRLVELVPSTTEPGSEKPFAKMLDGQIVSMTKEVEDVAAEFAREWPEFVSQEVVVSQEMGNPGGESTDAPWPPLCAPTHSTLGQGCDRRSRTLSLLADRPASKALL